RAFRFHGSGLKTNLWKVGGIKNLDAVHRVLNLRSGSFRDFGIQDLEFPSIHTQFNRCGIGLRYLAGLDRSLNFVIVSKGGKKAALVNVHRYRGMSRINFARTGVLGGGWQKAERCYQERQQ